MITLESYLKHIQEGYIPKDNKMITLEKLFNMMNIRPTKEMVKFYEERTRKHIKRVQDNIKKVIKNHKELNLKELDKRLMNHDKSKFSVDEYIPYIWMTEFYRRKQLGEEFKYPNKDIKKEINEAIKHHYKVNRHHPEFHNDIKNMNNEDIVEMVCDWAAMSQEFNNGLKEFADKKIDIKYKFTNKQTELIYQLIKEF